MTTCYIRARRGINASSLEILFVGPSSSNVKSLKLPQGVTKVFPDPVNHQKKKWKDKFSCEIRNEILYVKRVDSHHAWAQHLELQAFREPDPSLVGCPVIATEEISGALSANTFGKAELRHQWIMGCHGTSLCGTSIKISLYSSIGKYLSCKTNGQVRADAVSISDAELWKVVRSAADGFIYLKNCCYETYLSSGLTSVTADAIEPFTRNMQFALVSNADDLMDETDILMGHIGFCTTFPPILRTHGLDVGKTGSFGIVHKGDFLQPLPNLVAPEAAAMSGLPKTLSIEKKVEKDEKKMVEKETSDLFLSGKVSLCDYACDDDEWVLV